MNGHIKGFLAKLVWSEKVNQCVHFALDRMLKQLDFMYYKDMDVLERASS